MILSGYILTSAGYRRVYRCSVILLLSAESPGMYLAGDGSALMSGKMFYIGLVALTVWCWWNQRKWFHLFSLSQQTTAVKLMCLCWILNTFFCPKEILHSELKKQKKQQKTTCVVEHNIRMFWRIFTLLFTINSDQYRPMTSVCPNNGILINRNPYKKKYTSILLNMLLLKRTYYIIVRFELNIIFSDI